MVFVSVYSNFILIDQGKEGSMGFKHIEPVDSDRMFLSRRNDSDFSLLTVVFIHSLLGTLLAVPLRG